MRILRAQLAYCLWHMAKAVKTKKLSAFSFQLLAVFLLLTTLSLYHCTTAYAEWNPTHPDPIMEYHYSYDQVGNITAINDVVKNSTSTFTYDEVGRLTQAIGNYGTNNTQTTQNYSYDAVGNTLDIIPPATNTYDNGNIIDYNGKHIDYDYENRPIKITDTGTGVVTEFGYDYTGQRMWKVVTSDQQPATSDCTFYCGNIYEVHISSTGAETQTAHIYAGSLRVASRVTENGTSRTFYYLGDHLGSTKMMTDALGQVVQDISYEPWGSTVTESSTTYHANYKFTGQMLDDSTNLYYYGARYYDPQLRRFITPDTFVQSPYDPQSLNRYAYVRNNPLIYVDPTGHWVIGNFATSFLQVASYAAMFVPGPWSIPIAMVSAMGQSALSGGHFDEAMQAGIMGGLSARVGQGVAQGIGGAMGKGAGDWYGVLAQGAGAGFAAGGAGAVMSGASSAEAWKAAYQGAAINAAIAGGISLTSETADFMRSKMRKQSRIDTRNSSGESNGFKGDGFKLGGGRYDPNNPNAPASPLGGRQGGSGKIFGIPYNRGSVFDYIVEMYAGPHDFLNSWAYDSFTGNIRNLNTFEKVIGTFTNPLNVAIATPIAVISALPQATPPVIIYHKYQWDEDR